MSVSPPVEGAVSAIHALGVHRLLPPALPRTGDAPRLPVLCHCSAGACPPLLAGPGSPGGTGTGAESNKLHPDLATDLGTASNNNKTWKFTLKTGVKWEDGSPVTCADVNASVSLLKELPGIGDWTAQYIAMRALRDPDALPTGDLSLLKAVDSRNPKILAQAAEAWRPWRASAPLYLWNAAPSGC